MDRQIQAATERLIDEIKKSRCYEQYQKSMESLEAYPDEFERLMSLRVQTIRLYQEADDEELYTESERLTEEYEALQKLPEVNAFLEAEEELADVLQTVSERVLKAMEMRLPEE